MVLGHLALGGRIVLLGAERIIFKKVGKDVDSSVATFLLFILATLFLIPGLFFVKFPDNYGFLPYLMVSSALYALAFTLYVKSLSGGDVSLVSPLYNFNIFFLLVLTIVFLGESFSLFKLGGLVLLIYGASFLNKQENVWQSLRALIKDSSCLLMMSASLLIAVGRTIDGFVVQKVDPLLYVFGLYLGVTIFLLFYLLIKGKFKQVRGLLVEKSRLIVMGGAVNAYSYLLLLVAFTQIEVSVAVPASMLGMIVTLILAHFIFKEKIKTRLMGVVIMSVGGGLLFV